MLRDRRDVGGQAACQADQDVFDRGGPLVLGGKHLRMVGIELERLLAVLFRTQSIEPFNGGTAVGSIFPFARRAPLLELGCGRGGGEG